MLSCKQGAVPNDLVCSGERLWARRARAGVLENALAIQERLRAFREVDVDPQVDRRISLWRELLDFYLFL